jgi:peptide/nickel transport system substrate-binding protein
MLQQDLKRIGIRVNLAPLEFQSLIGRITSTNDYEACLLGLTNVEIDPNSQMNVWMSSGTHHPWNPGQAEPATPWEAEIDNLMRQQAGAASQAVRKKAFDRVQRIVIEEAPAIYLVNPDVLCAVSPLLRGAAPSPLPPHLYWNIENLGLEQPASRRK